MVSVWKFEFPIKETFVLDIPFNAKFRSLQLQGDTPCMWFEVETSAPKEKRVFHIVGTGHEVKGNAYVGTFQTPPYVWHVYESGLASMCENGRIK